MTAAETPASLLADEYVLGLLEPSEREVLGARLAHDDALRAAVASARERFIDLDLSALPLTPSDELWRRIDGALPVARAQAHARPRQRGSISGPSVEPPTRRVAGRWRGTALASMAASIVLLLLLAGNPWFGPPVEVIAVLLDDEGEPLVLVEVLPADAVRVTPLSDLDVPPGRTLELWTLPDPAAGPVSVGLLREARSRTLLEPSLPPPRPDQLYEISLEAAGGSSVGRPTGPVLVKGFARLPR